MHYRLATLHQANQLLERGIGGGGKTWPASPVYFECSTVSQCRATIVVTKNSIRLPVVRKNPIARFSARCNIVRS
jgi:hypothetical protein